MKRIFVTLMMLLLANFSRANNIQVTNVSVVPANNTIKFTISWDNSWRSSVLNNWDAAWVFLKYYNPIAREWWHLNFTNTGNVIPPGFSAGMESTGPHLGAFLYRSASGSGTSTLTNVELGIPAQQATGIYDIKVFAIEMVYIPQGEFYAGDEAAANRYGSSAALTAPGFVSSTSTSAVYDPLLGSFLTSLNASYPTGYNDFYCMKYELTQGGYRDFLNTLTYTQQANHSIGLFPPNSLTGSPVLTSSVGGINRNYLEIKTPGVSPTTPAVYGCDANSSNTYDEASDGEWIPCNFLNWPDHAAYLYWAGLRPLTELEYEKACRGIQLPVAGEFAWGNTLLHNVPYSVTFANFADEIVSASVVAGNANWGNTFPFAPHNGPLRNGVFATAVSNRMTSGGSFYGVMEMSGNLFERVVNTFNGAIFNGAHGNGVLTPSGYANAGAASWPGFNNGTFSIDGGATATGLCTRGGSWNIGIAFLQISNRGNCIIDANIARVNNFGVRGARTAP